MERKKRELMHRLLDLVLDVNGFEKREADKGLPCVMLDFSGHIAGVSLRVYKEGWEEGLEAMLSGIIKNADLNSADALDDLQYIIDALKRIKDGKQEE